MTTKTKIIIALIIVSAIVGISLFFYYRGKKAKTPTVTVTDLTVKKVSDPAPIAPAVVSTVAISKPLVLTEAPSELTQIK